MTWEEDFSGADGASRSDDNDARSICTIVPHELESVKEVEEQVARQ